MHDFQKQIDKKNNELEDLKNQFISFLYPSLNVDCKIELTYLSKIDKVCHINFIEKNKNNLKNHIIFKLYINYYKEDNIEYNYSYSNRYNEINNDDLLTMSNICLATQSIKDNINFTDINNQHAKYVKKEQEIKDKIENIVLDKNIYLKKLQNNKVENIKKILQPLSEIQKNIIKKEIKDTMEEELSIPVLLFSIQGDSIHFKNSYIKVKNKKRKLIYLNGEHISKSHLETVLSEAVSIKGNLVKKTYELNSILDMRNAISFKISINELFDKLKHAISVINF